MEDDLVHIHRSLLPCGRRITAVLAIVSVALHALHASSSRGLPYHPIPDCEGAFPLVLSRPLPVHADVDLTRLDEKAYRDALHLDDFVRAAKREIQERPGYLWSKAISATAYGLLYRAVVWGNATLLNAFYEPCPHLRPRDNEHPPLAVFDDMCPYGLMTNLTRLHHCLLVYFFDFDKRTHNLTQLISLDAVLVQTEIDRQRGVLELCGTQHGTEHVYRGTCL
jgi:hypothetical protein